ncbi:MAG TPA: hypothetical protein VHL31_03100 [Geminicoccus sp.]|jgi:hypothetical protein|uniref:hypothetical protein n=1 Tax=Geminicoccus sp. TaxID=2024832 RepID=UPI002E3602AE|nr:hypothetical protein [Geminicoccus sp.]HEX2525275.1 hypothetical protein [Geminicoccus sp.]
MHTDDHGSPSTSRWLLAAAAAAILLSGEAVAQVKEPELTRPDASVRELLAANAAEIQSVVERALDTQQPTKSRVDAVRQLSGAYFDYLLANSQALVRDPDPEVAHTTVLSLAGQIAMLPDVQVMEHHNHTEYDNYQSNLVKTSLDSLRQALEHDNAAVVDEAAAFLSSRGDLQGMARVQRLIEEGKISAGKGIGFLSLGPLEKASPLIEKYTSDPDTSVQAAAISQLSYNSRYTSVVRDVALSANTSSQVTIAALPGLAKTDRDFLNYGVALAQNEKVDKAVRSQALEAAIGFTIRNNTPESTVRSLEPLLGDAAAELSSPEALQAVEQLRSVYQIQ